MDLKEYSIKINENLIISYLDNKNSNKKILLFVHGWAADKYNLQIIYSQLLKDFRVISIDLPGFGKSSFPGTSANSMDYSQYIHEFLIKLNIENVNYIGHSFGGKIGILTAAHYPNLILRLILINSSGIKPKRNIIWYLKVGKFKLLKKILSTFLKDENAINKLKKKYGSDDYKNAGRMRDILVRIVNEDLSNILNKIKCPTFLYWGDKDKDTPLWMAKKMVNLINDAGLYVVKNGSHFSFVEDNSIISIIKSFST